MNFEFKRSTDGIGIPYPAVDRPDGQRNYGYIDLKQRPEEIDSIPELQDAPELKSLVVELNHPRSIVRSLSCEKALSPFNHPQIKFKLTSFVRICFEILSWNLEDENYRKLFENFEADVAHAKTDWEDVIVVEFEVDPATFRDHNTGGWALTIWNSGWGTTEAEARENWAIGVSLVEQFFGHQRAMFQGELDKGLTTISPLTQTPGNAKVK